MRDERACPLVLANRHHPPAGTARLCLLDRASFRRDGRRVEIDRLAGCEKLLERPLIHPYVAFQPCLEPPDGKASCRLIYRYANVGCHFAFSRPIAFPACSPAHANVDLHDCQLTFGRTEALSSVSPEFCGKCTRGETRRCSKVSRFPFGDPVERRIEFPTFPCYFLLLGQ